MPLYRCFTPDGTFDDDQRSAVARAITDIHCSETTAPPTFVHVQFLDAPARQAAAVAVHGGLRAGRPARVTDRIVARTTEAVATIAEVGVEEVAMRVSETPASWIYEGGRVLPEPGDEAAWMTGS